jgi:hypothetical protein
MPITIVDTTSTTFSNCCRYLSKCFSIVSNRYSSIFDTYPISKLLRRSMNKILHVTPQKEITRIQIRPRYVPSTVQEM